MKSTLRIYIGLMMLIFAAIIIIDLNKPKEIDWRPTFSTNDKIPFGLYILDQEIEGLLHNSIEKIAVTPYEYFDPLYDYDTIVNTYSVSGNFVDISEKDNLDQMSLSEVFYYVGHGNTALLSMKSYPAALLDSLQLQMEFDYRFTDSVAVWQANPAFGGKRYYLREGVGNGYFTKVDTLNTTILGYQHAGEQGVNFVKVGYRKGHFLLHTQPAAFTNFYLLKDNHASYAAGVLSYLPEEKTFWYTKDSAAEQRSRSMLRYILDQPALASAWFLFLGGMLVFILFNAKRKQRVVPVIKPLTNTTVEFTKTIANLYHQEQDYDAVIEKKIIYFLEKIRNEYLLDTTKLDEEFARKYAQKSGKDPALVKAALNRINSYRNSRHISIEADLIEINNAIEKII